MFARLPPLFLVAIAQGQISIGPPQEVSDYLAGPRFAQTVDMDGDGDLDVISASEGTSRISWWQNGGSGGFSHRRDWEWEPDSSTIGLADYDGDGRLDGWFLRPSGSGASTEDLWLAIGQAGGGFAAPVRMLSGMAAGLSGTAVVDVNGDGRPDLLSAAGGCFQRADGSFLSPPPVSHSPVEGTWFAEPRSSWTIGAFGGGGEPQVIRSQWPDKIVRNRIHPDGSFGETTIAYPFPANEVIQWIMRIPPVAGGALDRLAVVTETLVAEGGEPGLRLALLTFQADGSAAETCSAAAPERFYPNGGVWDESRQRLLINWWGTGIEGMDSGMSAATFNGGAATLTKLFSFQGATWTPALADLSGDGTEDLFLPLSSFPSVAGPFFDHLTWHQGSAAGVFEATPEPVNQPALANTLVYAGDMDGDGDGDIVTTGRDPLEVRTYTWDHELVVWRNQGGGFVREEVSNEHDGIHVIAVKDHDANGRLDILADTIDRPRLPDRTPTGFTTYRVVRFIQGMDGSFTPSTLVEETMAGGRICIGETDWNGDGIKDLLLVGGDDAGSAVSYRPGTAAGDYGSEVPFATLPPWFGTYRLMDMDWDGDLDIVMFGDHWNYCPSSWLENHGDGRASDTLGLPEDIVPLGGDLDGDGHGDFKNSNGCYLSRPGVTFAIRAASPAMLEQDRTTFLDLDQDGDGDWVVSNYALGVTTIHSLSWRENLRSGPMDARPFLIDPAVTAKADLPIAPPRVLGYQSAIGVQAALADMDGDGTPDLVTVWNSTFSGTGRVEWFKIAKTPASSAFTAWMGGCGLIGNSAGPLADWDGDGQSNWTEFAFGADPAAADSKHGGYPQLLRDGQGLWFQFRRRVDASTADLSYLKQRSRNLVNWEAWEAEATGVPASPGYETVTIPVLPSEPQEFFRIAIPPPPGR